MGEERAGDAIEAGEERGGIEVERREEESTGEGENEDRTSAVYRWRTGVGEVGWDVADEQKMVHNGLFARFGDGNDGEDNATRDGMVQRRRGRTGLFLICRGGQCSFFSGGRGTDTRFLGLKRV